VRCRWQREALDYACTSQMFHALVPSCPRTDVVGSCDVLTSPIYPYKAYRLIYKSPATPDTATFALNSLATCSGFPARDPAGNILQPSCSGTMTAKVDGVPVDFSARFICTYKTNSTKSEYFVRATYLPETTMVKELTVTVHEEGGQYTIAGTALSPAEDTIDITMTP
jgi:hypothetical protein